ncbi:nuclear transport factor 2 family protein [Flammeovirga sp. OC4]|uniref:nuclear transport factor 2 family protein n=1 Tax=Flammeovirga sp. OC4 TaxID=1382345 RepID=UPI0009E1AF5A|nr:nuclear transport factor 2 family protein [Flammeovirga sp. OC4]
MNSVEKAVTQIFIATDQQDWERLEVIFANQVELDYSSMNGNPATTLSPQEITSAWKGILPGFTHTHHQLGNMISTIEDNKAQVFCYGTATHFLEDERGNVWTVVGTYNFELVLISDEWKVSKMKFNFKYQDGNTSLPQKAIENITK